MRTAVILPVLNEADSIAEVIGALLSGRRVPDEIVVGDGGSTDGTLDILAGLADRHPIIRVVPGPGGIGENRNAAIEAAGCEVIACTDAGCVPDPDWLERLAAPFNDGAAWVAGMSRPADADELQAVIGLVMMPTPAEINTRWFIPGGASQAFLKSAWRIAGGFPEGMEAGEDTLFGTRMKSHGYQPVVVPEAQVVWQAPRTVGEMIRKGVRWGRADGIVNTTPDSYFRLAALAWGGAAALFGSLLFRRWRLATGILAASLGISTVVVSTKLRSLRQPKARLMLPILYPIRILAQTAGWAGGFHRSPRRDPYQVYALRAGRHGVSLIKRLVRPFIPGSVMVRFRKATPLGGRSNIDVLLPSEAPVRRWLDAIPDTYRVGVEPGEGSHHEMITRPEDLPPGDRARLSRALARPEIEAVVLASTEVPRIDIGRVNEPTIAPIAVAVRPGALDFPLPADPSGLMHLVGQAGLHVALIPTKAAPSKPSPRPINEPGAVVILGTVPMHDVGGGSRGAQMAHELVASGYHVTYLNLYESDETVDLGLRYVHPHLDQISARDFDFESYAERLATDTRIGILELPHPEYFRLLNRSRLEGFKIVYDLMDDWSDMTLGGWGYTEHDELETIRVASGLVASAPSLVSRLEEMSGREVALVPNAVNTRIFHPADHPRPVDLPQGEGPVLEYHGSLYGDWFDWEALERTAERHPTARLVIIGDDRNHPAMPGNVHFLGLKPQHHLPAYLAHSDVGVVPFAVSETTHAVSPLKVFECLAMGVPVASVPLDPVRGLPGVSTDIDLASAVTESLRSNPPDAESIALQHGWGNRMATVFATVGLELRQDPEAHPVVVSQHGVRHWAPGQRRI